MKITRFRWIRSEPGCYLMCSADRKQLGPSVRRELDGWWHAYPSATKWSTLVGAKLRCEHGLEVAL